MMNLPPVIWTISVAFVPVRFSPAVSVGGVAGAFGISFEALRSQPGSRATAQNKTEPARKTGERACLARCVRRPYVFNGRFTSVAAAILAAVGRHLAARTRVAKWKRLLEPHADSAGQDARLCGR